MITRARKGSERVLEVGEQSHRQQPFGNVAIVRECAKLMAPPMTASKVKDKLTCIVLCNLNSCLSTMAVRLYNQTIDLHAGCPVS